MFRSHPTLQLVIILCQQQCVLSLCDVLYCLKGDIEVVDRCSVSDLMLWSIFDTNNVPWASGVFQILPHRPIFHMSIHGRQY